MRPRAGRSGARDAKPAGVSPMHAPRREEPGIRNPQPRHVRRCGMRWRPPIDRASVICSSALNVLLRYNGRRNCFVCPTLMRRSGRDARSPASSRLHLEVQAGPGEHRERRVRRSTMPQRTSGRSARVTPDAVRWRSSGGVPRAPGRPARGPPQGGANVRCRSVQRCIF
jgi:hypothetical protein